jgi:hypothetical protein
VTTSHYGVLRIDDIWTPSKEVLDSMLDGTWWFQTDGTGDFSGSQETPEPATSLLLLVGAAALVAFRRR